MTSHREAGPDSAPWPGRLVDLGERRLISEVLAPRYDHRAYHYGDDCAIVGPGPRPGEFYVSTTDPSPQPLPVELGWTKDLYAWGWLLATINLSDIAASGAEPVALLSSLILPNDTPIDDFRRLLDGLDECASMYSVDVIGGNLKEGPNIDMSATALGLVHGDPLSRVGAKTGDLVAAIGSFGLYWAGVVARLRDLDLNESDHDRLEDAVFRPRPQVLAGQALKEVSVVHACLDNSDGLFASLTNLVRANGIGFSLSLRDDMLDPTVLDVARRAGLEPLRLGLGFGDWNLIACFPEEAEHAAREAVTAAGSSLLVLGRVVDGDDISLEYNGKKGHLRSVDSERFRNTSVFTAGISSYIDALLNEPYAD